MVTGTGQMEDESLTTSVVLKWIKLTDGWDFYSSCSSQYKRSLFAECLLQTSVNITIQNHGKICFFAQF